LPYKGFIATSFFSVEILSWSRAGFF